jgi:hypothetical protein
MVAVVASYKSLEQKMYLITVLLKMFFSEIAWFMFLKFTADINVLCTKKRVPK